MGDGSEIWERGLRFMIAGLRFIGRGSEIWERGLESEAGVWNRVPGSGIGSWRPKNRKYGLPRQIYANLSNLSEIGENREILRNLMKIQ